MAEETSRPKTAVEHAILQQQFRRALSSFEGIILSQIDLKNRLSTRLNYSVQVGTFILVAISISIGVLLFTLTSQVSRIASVVDGMNAHFVSVAGQMSTISLHMTAIEKRVALLEEVDARTSLMDAEMMNILADMSQMRNNVGAIDGYLGIIRTHVGNISVNMDLMNLEVQNMSVDMSKISRPMRSMNKMIPFP